MLPIYSMMKIDISINSFGQNIFQPKFCIMSLLVYKRFISDFRLSYGILSEKQNHSFLSTPHLKQLQPQVEELSSPK